MNITTLFHTLPVLHYIHKHGRLILLGSCCSKHTLISCIFVYRQPTPGATKSNNKHIIVQRLVAPTTYNRITADSYQHTTITFLVRGYVIQCKLSLCDSITRFITASFWNNPRLVVTSFHSAGTSRGITLDDAQRYVIKQIQRLTYVRCASKSF